MEAETNAALMELESAKKYPEVIIFFKYAMRDCQYGTDEAIQAWHWYLKGFLIGVSV